MKHLRLSIIGFGTVGQGLAELLSIRQALLRQDFGLEVSVISVANARHGFIYREEGLDIPTLLELAATKLVALAQQHGVQLRMEATVMAGTPVLSTIREGMAGAKISAIRGILNGTTNYILSAMATGRDYAEVLAEAQAEGYAEADPTADVDGYDAVAKTLILAALVFGRPLKSGQVLRQGITTVTREQVQQALHNGKRIKLIASLQRLAEDDSLEASVEPTELPLSHPLARVDGIMNAITIHTDALAEVTVIGPGAGRLQTGQGLLADLLAIAQPKQ